MLIAFPRSNDLPLRWSPVLMVLVSVVLAGTVVQADDSPILLDRIVAIVDEEAILQSDLDREVELYRMEREYAGEAVTAEPAQIRAEMLERLVEGKLIIAAAKQADMKVDEEVIQESVDQKIQQFVDHFGSMENLERELKRSGMNLSDYKARMTAQLRDQQYLRLVVGKFIRPRIEVLENEVQDYYLENLASMPSEPDSITISNIMVSVQPSVEVRREIQSRVADIRSQLAAGIPFEDLAAQYSKGPNAARGGAIGVVAPGDLFDPALDRAVFALGLGEVSEPVVTQRGVHLMKVDSLEGDGRRAISQIFLPIEVSQTDVDAARDRIEAARMRIMDGQSFGMVAADMSDDSASARNGGLLGTFPVGDLSPQFQGALENVEPGQVTEPVVTPAGWYIFRVEERLPGHMYTFEELKDQLRQMVENTKIEAALNEYVKELRTRFFIDEKS